MGQPNIRSVKPRAPARTQAGPSGPTQPRDRDPHNEPGGEYRYFSDVFALSALLELGGLPYPVHFRNVGLVPAWKNLLRGLPEWDWMAQPHRTICELNHFIGQDIVQQYRRDFPDSRPGRWSGIIATVPTQVAAMTKFDNERGKVINVSRTLDTLLMHTDVDLTLPMAQLAPKFSAQYIKFDPAIAAAMTLPGSSRTGCVFDGVFCFLTPPDPNATMPGKWMFELVFMTRVGDVSRGALSMMGPTDRQQGTLANWFESVMASSAVPKGDVLHNFNLAYALSYVIKVLLYMGLNNVTVQEHVPFSAAMARLAGLGTRKQAKLMNRMNGLYDAIVVGPAATAPGLVHAERGMVASHWRRGHFRLQPCGPERMDRKLIFIAPILVHADQAMSEMPRAANAPMASMPLRRGQRKQGMGRSA